MKDRMTWLKSMAIITVLGIALARMCGDGKE